MLDLSQDYFALFGLPVGYSVDTEQLAERYRALQQALHPDRFAGAGEREKRLSMQASTRVNQAYQTLRDPLARARYLLSLHTGDTSAGSETVQDMAFLMEQMELREALAHAKEEADPYATVGQIMNRLAEQSNTLVAKLASRLDAPSPQDLDEALGLVQKLQFIYKCRAEAEQIEAELDDAH